MPCGLNQEDVVTQTQVLKSAFINYLKAKLAAGIINVPNPGSNQVCAGNFFVPIWRHSALSICVQLWCVLSLVWFLASKSKWFDDFKISLKYVLFYLFVRISRTHNIPTGQHFAFQPSLSKHLTSCSPFESLFQQNSLGRRPCSDALGPERDCVLTCLITKLRLRTHQSSF